MEKKQNTTLCKAQRHEESLELIFKGNAYRQLEKLQDYFNAKSKADVVRLGISALENLKQNLSGKRHQEA